MIIKLVLQMEADPEKLFMNVRKVARTLRSENKIELIFFNISFPYNCLQNDPNFTFNCHYNLKILQDEMESLSMLNETPLKTLQHITGGGESQAKMWGLKDSLSHGQVLCLFFFFFLRTYKPF